MPSTSDDLFLLSSSPHPSSLQDEVKGVEEEAPPALPLYPLEDLRPPRKSLVETTKGVFKRVPRSWTPLIATGVFGVTLTTCIILPSAQEIAADAAEMGKGTSLKFSETPLALHQGRNDAPPREGKEVYRLRTLPSSSWKEVPSRDTSTVVMEKTLLLDAYTFGENRLVVDVPAKYSSSVLPRGEDPATGAPLQEVALMGERRVFVPSSPSSSLDGRADAAVTLTVRLPATMSSRERQDSLRLLSDEVTVGYQAAALFQKD